MFYNPVFCLLFHHDADSFTKFLSLGQLGQREKKRTGDAAPIISVRKKKFDALHSIEQASDEKYCNV